MQKLKFILAVFIVAVCSPAIAIWNSSNFQKEKFNFVFRFETQMLCSATLLTKTIAITAAHCFLNFDHFTNKKLRATDYTNQDIGSVRFKRIVFHPNFDMDDLINGTLSSEQSAFDMALIIFSESSEYINNSTAAYLEKYSLPAAPFSILNTDQLMGLGLGDTDDNGYLSDLGAINLKSLSTTDSQSAFLRFLPANGNQSMCPGDSGGPIMKIHKGQPLILGNLSGKVNTRTGSDVKNARVCEDDHHMFFVTNYFSHRGWINSVISGN